MYKHVLDKLFDNQFDLFLSTEILLEYEEKIAYFFSLQTAELITGAISLLPNVKETKIFYNLNLISTDEDDNKFVDCAFSGNVNYLVTDDKHYNILKTIVFPKINIISLADFSSLLKTS